MIKLGNIIKLFISSNANRPDVKINEVTINTILHTYNKMNKPDKTIDTFELYQQYNIEPDIICL